MSLSVDELAPDFTSTDQNGQPITLSDYRGKKVVLYFYPKDDTPGCTAQACSLRDNYVTLQKAGYEVLGVSVDDENSHQKFIKKFDLPFTLVSDIDHKIVEDYDVWKEKTMYGRNFVGIVRTTFIIDENGTITDIISKIDTQNHAEQILK